MIYDKTQPQKQCFSLALLIRRLLNSNFKISSVIDLCRLVMEIDRKPTANRFNLVYGFDDYRFTFWHGKLKTNKKQPVRC